LRNYTARSGSTLTLDDDGDLTKVDLYSSEGLDMLSNLWIKVAAEHRLMYEPTWLGRPIIQYPTDIVVIQELLWRVKPDLVIETGVAHGGSLMLSASILELIGRGSVIGIDIDIRPHNRLAINEHPLSHRIELIEGSSISDDTFSKVNGLSQGAEMIVVFLDSNHSEQHVLAELNLYSTLVKEGGYIVAHDGAQGWVWDIPRAKAEWQFDHPLGAIKKFLEDNSDFIIDPHWNRFGITCSPDGFLRRVRKNKMSEVND
jgi:cephalosporin hydroxylase